jgi:hypothetical protein
MCGPFPGFPLMRKPIPRDRTILYEVDICPDAGTSVFER